MNWRRIRKWFLLLAVCGTIVLFAVAWFVGGKLIEPANRVVGPPPDDFPASSLKIESESGATLAAWHLPVPESTATAILLHPHRMDRRAMLSRARLLRQHGYSTLLIDFQAHGESKGDNVTVGYLERHDVLAAIEYVRNYDKDQEIALIGRSLGGAAALLARADVDAIVLESVFPTVSEAVHNRVEMRLGFLHHVVTPLLLGQLNPRLGISPSQLCPIDQLEEIHCPILIAAGDSDQHTTIEETRRIFERTNEPKRQVIFEGAGHVDLLKFDQAKYENQIVAFLNEIIGDRIPVAELTK